MRCSTSIDTIGIQVNLREEDTRDFILDGILTHLREKNYYVAEKPYSANDYFFRKEYYIYAYNQTLCSLRLGSFSSKISLTDIYTTTYYIAIEFAGLKRYHEPLDTISKKALLIVSAYFNTRNIFYKLTNLDICMDMYTGFENVLALCTKKYPKTAYFTANEPQPYETTRYIEKITYDKLDEVMQRSYLYDKSLKEGLPFHLIRFELKLQAKFFSKNSDNLIGSILSALDRYHVMYIPLKKERNYLVQQYDACPILRERDIKRIGFDKYRCYSDPTAIHAFISEIFSIKERDLKLI